MKRVAAGPKLFLKGDGATRCRPSVGRDQGREETDVTHKDRPARIWCGNASRPTGHDWRDLKVPQTGCERLQPTAFSDLVSFDAGASDRDS